MFAIRRTFNRLGERPKLCPMEEPKVKLVVFNHGKVPTTHSGKEQGEIYACSIWDPHLKKDIEMLESVQKFGLKVCLKQWHSTYENLIDQAGIPSLAVRRKLLKLCQLYNILNAYGHVNFLNLPTSCRPTSFVNRIRSVHPLSLSKPFSHSNFHCSSFFPSAISLWSTLPRDICTCHTLQTFKRAVLNHFTYHS